MRSNNKGITLIVLIITVIILLILTGLVMDFAIDGRIFDSAKEVVNKQEEQVNQQQQMVNDVRDLYR